MNVHVSRVAARDRRRRLDRFTAACLVSLFLGLCLGRSNAQEAFSSTVGLGNAGYPISAIAQANAATATTGGIAFSLPAGSISQYTYICGFSVSPGSATAAITLSVTLSNVLGGTETWSVGAPVTAAGVTGAILTVNFAPCLRSAVQNSTVVLNVGALGAGGVGQAANMWGFQQ